MDLDQEVRTDFFEFEKKKNYLRFERFEFKLDFADIFHRQIYQTVMGWSNELKTALRNISNAKTGKIVSVVVGSLGFCCHLAGIVSDKWLVGASASNFTYSNQGLWEFCNVSSGYKCCSRLSDHLNEIGSSKPGKYKYISVYITSV